MRRAGLLAGLLLAVDATVKFRLKLGVGQTAVVFFHNKAGESQTLTPSPDDDGFWHFEARNPSKTGLASAIDIDVRAVISGGMPITFQHIREAAERISGQVIKSPCLRSIPLSEATGSNIFCKLEYLQRTGSFKERGARNALLQLAPEQKRLGVIAASAGNHALGVAYHAELLGVPATVVMPRFAPLPKVSNCRRLGATVVSHGAGLGEAKLQADEIASERQLAYVNGYDNPAIIAGQGTLGLEIVAQVAGSRRGDCAYRRGWFACRRGARTEDAQAARSDYGCGTRTRRELHGGAGGW